MKKLMLLIFAGVVLNAANCDMYLKTTDNYEIKAVKLLDKGGEWRTRKAIAFSNLALLNYEKYKQCKLDNVLYSKE